MAEFDLPYHLGDFVFESLGAQHFCSTVECVNVVWPSSNLIVKALNIDSNRMNAYSKKVVQRAVDEDLSVVCIDKRTEQVIGFALSEDLDAPPLPQTENLDREFQIWMQFTTTVEEPFHKKFKISGEKVFHASMGGVKSEYEGLYLARICFLLAIKKASDKGYEKMFSVLTHSGSQGIAADRNATELYRIKFSSFDYQNTKPLSHIPLESCSIITINVHDHTAPDKFSNRMKALEKVHLSRLSKPKL